MSGEPETVQFPAVTLGATELVADSAPQAAQPEPVTEQFPAIPAGTGEPGSPAEPQAAASRPEPVAAA
ncbi:MAG: hypothetical protein ACLP8X_26205, partial [Streptosporangiaceae bacterium]